MHIVNSACFSLLFWSCKITRESSVFFSVNWWNHGILFQLLKCQYFTLIELPNAIFLVFAFFFFFWSFPGASGNLYWYIQRRLIRHYFVLRYSTFSINNSVLPGSCNRTVFILDIFYGWICIFWSKLISKFHTLGKQKIRQSVIR